MEKNSCSDSRGNQMLRIGSYGLFVVLKAVPFWARFKGWGYCRGDMF